MTATAASSSGRAATARPGPTKVQVGGFVLVLLAFILFLWVVPGVTSDERRFLFERPPDPASVTFSPSTLVGVIAGIYLLVGVASIFEHKLTKVILGRAWAMSLVLVLPLVLAIALGRSERSSTNLTNLVQQSLFLATPIALGAMTGLWSERAGIINIGIEGMMLAAAGVGFMTYALLGDGIETWALWVSILVAVIVGALAALLLAVLSIYFRVNQIIAGVVINLLALGITGFLRSQVIVKSGVSGGVSTPSFDIPLLSNIPVIGKELFVANPIYLSMFFVVFFTWVVMYKTAWGLRVRACGEDPDAAESVGINVVRTRYLAVLIGGCIAGLAGAWVSLEPSAGFDDGMTANRGFIALAALIFGKWRPWGAFGGAVLFGFSSALQTRLQTLRVDIGGFAIPSEFWQMLPYVITLLVVCGLVGRAIPPAAEGEPWEPAQ